MEAEAVHRHDQAAKLRNHILAGRHSSKITTPLTKVFGVASCPGPDAKRTGKVIEDDQGIRKRLRQFDHQRQLMVELPGFKTEAARFQLSEGRPKSRQPIEIPGGIRV